MKDALDVHRALLAADVPHEIVRLPRPVTGADDIPDALDLSPSRCVAVRLYLADGEPVAVLVRAQHQPHPAAVLDALRRRSLRPMTAPTVNAVTDFAANLVSPVLLPADMPVLVDSCVGHHDVVYVPTGDVGTALGIRTTALLQVTGARAAELCAPVDTTRWETELPRVAVDVTGATAAVGLSVPGPRER